MNEVELVEKIADMKILINCINLLTEKQGSGGAGQYVYHLVRELSLMQEVCVLVNVRNYVNFTAFKNLKLVPLASNELGDIHRHFSWCDIYLCPLNELVPEYISVSKPVVATILDVQHEVFPHFFKGGVYEQRNLHYSYAIKRADAVITISKAEQKLIQSLYDKQSVYVTYLAGYLSRSFNGKVVSLPDYLSDCEYLLYPAIPWRHKNHYRLIEAFWMLKSSEEKYSHLKLVMTGATHELSSGAVSSLIEELGLTEDIIITGHVSNEELVSLLKNTSAMVFPSLYEGFGIPVVDAMEFSIPVIASPIPAISEICGVNISYFENPYDSVVMAEDIAKFLDHQNDSSMKKKIQDAANFAKKYSPQQTAIQTLDILERTISTYRKNLNITMPVENHNEIVHRNLNSSKLGKITLILDFNLISGNAEVLESSLEHLKSAALNQQKYNFKILLLLPRKSGLGLKKTSLQLLNFEDQQCKRVFFEDGNQSSYCRAYSYLFDSVIDTPFFLIASEIGHLTQLLNNAASAINTLELRRDFSAVKILQHGQLPSVKSPLTGVNLISAYELNKSNRVSFFTDMVLRVAGQTMDSHVGTYRYLNEFLASAYYVNNSLDI